MTSRETREVTAGGWVAPPARHPTSSGHPAAPAAAKRRAALALVRKKLALRYLMSAVGHSSC